MISYRTFQITLAAFVCGVISLRAQNTVERKQLFDYNWKFFLGDAPPLASARTFDDGSWRSLDLPHDWSIEGQVSPKNITGKDGGYLPAGIGWYRKSFKAPARWQGKSVSIYFEGVYMNAEVFVNGKSLGVYPYGFSSFSYDITPQLEIDNENVISVRVDNSKQKNCRWYSGSGIYRHVWLVVTDPVHIATWGVAVKTPQVSAKKATVQVKTRVKNETDLPQKVELKTTLVASNTKPAGSNHTQIELQPHTEKEIIQNIAVASPQLWQPETPTLYQAHTQLVHAKTVIDNTNTTFGIRSIKFSAEKGFQLNDHTLKLNGGCVHHDNGCLGAAAFDRAEERRVEILKAAGFNAIRTAHNVPSEAFLNACDRLGILVIDEAFDGWREKKNEYDYALFFNAWWQRDLESMVLRDQNHPSIIMWSIGNEIIERKKPEAIETATTMANCIRKIDTTRPVTSAMATWDTDWEIYDPLFAAQDIGGYNYQLHRAPADHARVPTRIIFQTESYPRDAFANWKLVQSHSYILGDFVWTALDYLGEAGIGRWYYTGEAPGEHWLSELFPWHGAYCGDIDLIGQRKPISHYRSMLYNNNEKLYMAVREPNPSPFEINETMWSVWPTWQSWNWPGYEGKDVHVEVYSKYPAVQLYLNNVLVGEQPTTEKQQFKATFAVPYAPGELKAIAVQNNRQVESATLQTAGNATQLKLIADRTKILANGQDLSFITVEITDEKGIRKADAANKLQFTLTGAGTIAGVDNGDLKDVDQYVGTTRKAWHGRALVVVRSTKNAGDMLLRVSSPGLADATITISTAGN